MDWRYIAGFFDGEGTITKAQKRHRIAITQTNLEVLEQIAQYVGVGRVTSLTKRKEHWKDSWLLYISDMVKVRYFLKQIFPYLIVKREKAIITIKEIEERLATIEERKSLKNKRRTYAKQLRQAGLTYRAIGKEIGIDWGYVRHLIKGTK